MSDSEGLTGALQTGSRFNYLCNGGRFAYNVIMDSAITPKPQAGEVTGEQELHILTEIGQILSATLELRDAFAKTMQIISDKLNMRRGALVLLDESTGRLRTEAAVGMTQEEIERGRYALG